MCFGPRALRIRLTHRQRRGKGWRQYGAMTDLSSMKSDASLEELAPLDCWPKWSIVLRTCVRISSGSTTIASHSSLSVRDDAERSCWRIAVRRYHVKAEASRSRVTSSAFDSGVALKGKTDAPLLSRRRVRSTQSSPWVTLCERRLRPKVFTLFESHLGSWRMIFESSRASLKSFLSRSFEMKLSGEFPSTSSSLTSKPWRKSMQVESNTESNDSLEHPKRNKWQF